GGHGPSPRTAGRLVVEASSPYLSGSDATARRPPSRHVLRGSDRDVRASRASGLTRAVGDSASWCLAREARPCRRRLDLGGRRVRRRNTTGPERPRENLWDWSVQL